VKRLSAGQKGTPVPDVWHMHDLRRARSGVTAKEAELSSLQTESATANDLCVNYANKLPAYVSIHSYLLTKGFSQSGEPTALGLEQNGTLSFIGTNTIFTSKSSAHPDATSHVIP